MKGSAMTYLDPVRLHFSGRFQADPSTVNNDPTHFDNATFKPNYQQPGATNGWWNPDGSGSFRLVDCRVTRVCYGDGSWTDRATVEPVIGMRIADADTRVAGKLVDLDPEQQMVSQIWGLVVRLMNGSSDVFVGPYDVAAFTDLWPRAKGGGGRGDMSLGAYYQSVIGPVRWGETDFSRFLRELRGAASDGFLSIKFNVDGYSMNSASPNFTLGRIVGTIGPAHANEPRHFVIGRQLGGTDTHVNYMPCVVDPAARRITADFGNALPTTTPGGPLLDIGDLSLGWVDSNGGFHSFGAVAYRDAGWYESTAGVQSFEIPQQAIAPLASAPVALRNGSSIILQENLNGLYARADAFVYRLYPGDRADVQIYATQYGVLMDDAPISVFLDPSQLQGDQTTPPVVAIPTGAIGGFDPQTPIVAKNGLATLTLTSSDPGNPRVYIDGQVYGVRYLPQPVYEAVYETVYETLQQNAPGTFMNPSDFVSVLIWNEYTAPDPLTWFDDLQPIFTQYANLYPIMDKLIDLSDYEAVAGNAGILSFVFSLPVGDPNSMPVTRDLSPAKRQAIVKWLNTPGEDGKPLLGTAKPAAAALSLHTEVAVAPTRMNRIQAIKSGRIVEEEES
jgi:hypothetical protein